MTDWQTLQDASLAVRLKAYAPYSKFLVGAAIESTSGEIFTGCNVENASYGMTICAERTAVVKAVSMGQTQFTRLALAIKGNFFPCGACLQVLSEFCPELPILVINIDAPEKLMHVRLSELMPRRFTLSDS